MIVFKPKYKFISLDLSKANTGCCVAYLDDTFLKVSIETKSITLNNSTYYSIMNANDCQFLEVKQILDKIEHEIKKDSLIKFIILENPIFHSFSTELSYYMFQSVLSIAFKYNIDCISIVPITLKKYINSSYEQVLLKKIPKKGKVLDKQEIKYAYEALKDKDHFKKYFNLKDPKNNDVMDAFFLMDYIISSFNKNYIKILNDGFLNPKDYEDLTYIPLFENEYNLKNHLDNGFFTLRDRKFYALKYIKKINFINN